MCLYPTLIRNRKYSKNQKNGGNVPPLPDPRVAWVPIGCQQCIECKTQKARSWTARLLEHIKTRRNGKFITLTFTNEHYHDLSTKITNSKGALHLDNEIATYAMRKFLERWRKHTGKSLEHWFVTELGHEGTENIHLHGIIWTNKSLNWLQDRLGSLS